MMLALVLTPARAEQVKEALAGHDLVFDQGGFLDSTGIRNALQAAARVAADTLILDIDAGPGPDLVAAVQGYRISRPAARIILLAPGREPGDTTVAALVGLGVYDILDGPVDAAWGELVARALTRPPATYAQAARWHIATGPPAAPDAAAEKERVIIEQRPAGIVLIAVAGAAPGLGCTYTALAISAFLARQGHRAALVEGVRKKGDDEQPPLKVMLNILEVRTAPVEGAWRMAGVDVYPFTRYETYDPLLALARSASYDYIVIDLGAPGRVRHDDDVIREMRRANLAVLVASPQKWRWPDLHEFLLLGPGGQQIPPEWRIALDLATPAQMKEIGLPGAVALPFCPDPFRPGPEAEEALGKLLEPVLPQLKPQKSLWSLFTRR